VLRVKPLATRPNEPNAPSVTALRGSRHLPRVASRNRGGEGLKCVYDYAGRCGAVRSALRASSKRSTLYSLLGVQ